MNSNATFERITVAQEKILVALATFKFLTTGQLLDLKVMTDRANINKQLGLLRNSFKPLIGSIAFGVHPKLGKLESVHYLTAHGALLLQELYGERYYVRYPKGKNGLFQQDYFHRIHTIDVHIAFNRWAMASDMDILFFQTYFDKLSSGREKGYRAESAILISDKNYLIADALCLLSAPRREELYAIEMYNGNDTNRVHNSLFAHLQALNNGQPSKQFGLNYGSRVLCVFEFDNYKNLAMKRLSEDKRFASAKSYFLFKSLEELGVDDFFDWWLFDGTKGSLF
ncbi:MAG: hypothetical protein PSV16_11570 [Flavobacterium sp.]|nr:hypothetical protein [Flavobacterium sp.]